MRKIFEQINREKTKDGGEKKPTPPKPNPDDDKTEKETPKEKKIEIVLQEVY